MPPKDARGFAQLRGKLLALSPAVCPSISGYGDRGIAVIALIRCRLPCQMSGHGIAMASGGCVVLCQERCRLIVVVVSDPLKFVLHSKNVYSAA